MRHAPAPTHRPCTLAGGSGAGGGGMEASAGTRSSIDGSAAATAAASAASVASSSSSSSAAGLRGVVRPLARPSEGIGTAVAASGVGMSRSRRGGRSSRLERRASSRCSASASSALSSAWCGVWGRRPGCWISRRQRAGAGDAGSRRGARCWRCASRPPPLACLAAPPGPRRTRLGAARRVQAVLLDGGGLHARQLYRRANLAGVGAVGGGAALLRRAPRGGEGQDGDRHAEASHIVNGRGGARTCEGGGGTGVRSAGSAPPSTRAA